MPAPNDLIVELRDVFADNFNIDELTDFALELGVDLEDVPGSTRKAKARELASYLSRHDLIASLATVGPEARPDIDWTAILSRYGIMTDAPLDELTPVSTTSVPFTDLQRLQVILADRPMFMTPESRRTTLVIAGLGEVVNVDFNGNSLVVAGAVLDQLNRYGVIAPGVTALGRLLTYLRLDPALPPDQLKLIDDIMARNALVTGAN